MRPSLRLATVSLVALAACFEPVDVGFNDAGRDARHDAGQVVTDGGGGGAGGGPHSSGSSDGGESASSECWTPLSGGGVGGGGGAPRSGPGWLATLVPGPPGTGHLNSVFIRQDGDVFVAGDSNRLFRRTGPGWTRIATGLANDARILQVVAVWDLVIIHAEQNGAFVAQQVLLDGGAWRPLPPHVVPQGATPVLLSRPQPDGLPTLVATDGGTWTVSRLGWARVPPGDAGSVPQFTPAWELLGTFDAGTAPTAVATGGRGYWVAVDGGLSSVGYDGLIAAPQPALTPACSPVAAFFVYQDPAGSHAAVVTPSGMLCRSLHNGPWIERNLGSTVRDVADYVRWDVIAVGGLGAIWTMGGERLICSGTREPLRSVHNSATQITWAVGANNTVVRIDKY
jgi:hypothetical protein